jgi:hypothetical protein
MAEFAVAVGVLALLLAGLPVLQRYHQLQFAAVGAARESAWLSSWRAGVATPAQVVLDLQQVQGRWLPEGAGNAALQVPPQPTATSVRFSASHGPLPGMAGQGAQALLLPLRPLQVLGSGSAAGADLQANGLVHARASLEVATPGNAPEPYAGLGLVLEEQHVLVADGWGAAGPAQVVTRVSSLVPSSLLARVPGLVTVGTTLLSAIEPQFRHFCPGYIDPEVVPADRLSRAVNELPASSWRIAC